MPSPLKLVAKVVRNPHTPQLLTLLFFVTCFYTAPYNSITSILSLLIGLVVLYLWTNILSMHSMRADLLHKKGNAELRIQRLRSPELNNQRLGDEVVVNNILSRIKRKLADPREDYHTQLSNLKIKNIIAEYKITKLDDFIVLLNNIDQRDQFLNFFHKLTAALGFICMSGGAAVQIYGSAIAMNPGSTNSTTCLTTAPGATTSPPVKDVPFYNIGFAILTSGFLLSGAIYFILYWYIKNHKEKVDLVLQALTEEETYPDRLISQTSNPDLTREVSSSGALAIVNNDANLAVLPTEQRGTMAGNNLQPAANIESLHPSPLKICIDALKSRDTPQVLTLAMFVACFYAAPYSPISYIVMLFLGISFLNMWSYMLAMHDIRPEFLSYKFDIEAIVDRLTGAGVPAVENIKQRATGLLSDPSIDINTQEKCDNIIALLTDNNITKLSDIKPFLDQLNRRDEVIHLLFKICDMVGFLFMASGAGCEIYGYAAPQGSTTTNSTCVTPTPTMTTMPGTTVPASSTFGFIKIGSLGLSSGFAIAGLAYFIFSLMAESNKDKLALILNALREEESYPDIQQGSQVRGMDQRGSDSVSLRAFLRRSDSPLNRAATPPGMLAGSGITMLADGQMMERINRDTSSTPPPNP